MPIIGAAQFKLLERLCNAMAVSGDEGEVRRIVLDEIRPYVNDLKVDALGNLLATKSGAGKKRLRVMLDAHMDEVGFMIVAQEGDGIYRFEKIGGIDIRYLAGKQVVVGQDHLPGVIGARPIHLAASEELTHKIELESLRIDVGINHNVKAGDRASFVTKFKRAGPAIMAKSIDDRIGVAILIELIKHTPANIDLCAAFSVQEEIGLRGAKVAAHFFAPDLAIAIEATPARDLPSQNGSENTTYNTRLGLGPAVGITDGAALHDSRLVQLLCETAEAEGILHQLRQPGGGGTDSGAIQRALDGIPTVSVSVPHRYTHSPISIARVDDWKNTLNLLHAALKRLTPAVIR